jgi:hypothetical protein
MKRTILTIMTAGALLIIQGISQARIGWTLEQCRERYGKETNIHVPGSVNEVVEFRVGNFFVGCSFIDNKVAYINYFKEEPWGKKFSDEELNDLLEKNSNGCIWKPEGSNGWPEHKRWVEEVKAFLWTWTGFRDGKPVMSATYVDDSSAEEPRPTFVIQTLEYSKAFDENLQKRAKKMTQQEQQAWAQEQKARMEQHDAKQREKRKEAADKATEGL